MSTIQIKTGDTYPPIEATITQADGTPLDITGATVKFHMNDMSGVNKINAAGTIISPTGGEVRYTWATTSTYLGRYVGEFEITLLTGKVLTVPNDGHLVIYFNDDLA